MALSKGRKKAVHAHRALDLAAALEDDRQDFICQPCKLDSKTYSRLQIIIAGSIRAPHRLKHTGRVSTHQCPHPGCRAARCDTEHLFWNCPAFAHLRTPFLSAIDRILARLDTKPKFRAKALRDLLTNITCRKCGIVPGDLRTLESTYAIDVVNPHVNPPTQEQRVLNSHGRTIT